MMKQIYLGSILSASKWKLVYSTTPYLDDIFVTEHNAMTLQDNKWTNMVNSLMDIEDEKYLVTEEIKEVL